MSLYLGVRVEWDYGFEERGEGVGEVLFERGK